ncbi:DUF2712 domain-containing protein [Heyndrickxia sp. NPDC080065]|uniref:DUF2712 domain-containing protein n=1 Tax=Heyndrickxia sp. NPDC080065 TaxID=3390568 RepID=UPI003CFC4ED8
MELSNAASNHEDSPFTFILGQNDQTSARQKLNKTSAYMKATSINGGAYSARVTLENGTPVGQSTTIKLGQGTKLRNYAVETYGEGVYVRIKGSLTGGVNAASGKWSPDSI